MWEATKGWTHRYEGHKKNTYISCANLPEKPILTNKMRRNNSNRQICHEDGRRRGVA